MKKQVVLLVTICIAALMTGNCKVCAQEGNSKNNGTLQIIKLCIPDSVIFTVVPGKEIEYIRVSLIGDGKEINGETYVSGIFNLKTVNGQMIYTYNQKSRLSANSFNIPEGFNAERIKFETDGKEMYYDILKSAWDK